MRMKYSIICILSLSLPREYPCDHYTSVINVTLLMTGCPRIDVHTTAVQLLQVLDKRFFGNVVPLQIECEKGKFIGKFDRHFLKHPLYCYLYLKTNNGGNIRFPFFLVKCLTLKKRKGNENPTEEPKFRL